MKNENKKKIDIKKMALILLMLVCIVVLGIGALFIRGNISKFGIITNTKTQYSTELYELPYYSNDYQRNLYEDLAKACNELGDQPTQKEWTDIAPLLTKLFISDYFTWNNKNGNYNIGGMNYVFGERRFNISQESRYYFYRDWDLLENKYGKENLPEVTDVYITDFYHMQGPYEFSQFEYVDGSKELTEVFYSYDAYRVSASWSYNESEVLNDYHFPINGNFVLVYSDKNKRLEIVSYHEYY